MGASKAQRAATAERRAKAIKLRIAAATWDQIAEQLGYASRAAACKDVTRALAQSRAAVQSTADEHRALEITRLDRLQVGLWTKATGGDVKAAEAVRRIILTRARLEGSDLTPDAEERIRREMTDRVAAQMAVVWGSVLDGLGLSDEQAARVPELLDAAIARFSGQQQERTAGRRRAIEAAITIDDDLEGAA